MSLLYATHARIHLGNVRDNLRAIRAAVGPSRKVLIAVKANGYGHGAVEVSRMAEATGTAEWLGVATVPEGVQLREAGLRLPILKLGPTFPWEMRAAVEAGVTLAVCSSVEADAAAEAARAAGRPASVHLKVDTGMSRLGAQADELATFLAAAKTTPQLELDGFMSHFASADVVGDPKNLEQVADYESAIAKVRRQGFSPRWLHFANTPALLTGVHGDAHTLLRPGGGLYGLDTRDQHAGDDPLAPILRWTTKPIHVKHVPAGTSVSYGARWAAKRDSIVATLPVGYADGYPRIMTAKANVLVKGELAPIAGTICMDLCLADVTDIPGVSSDDEVVLIGEQGGRRLTADDLARWAGTISYEITCGIGPRVPRRYVGLSEAVSSAGTSSSPPAARGHRLAARGSDA
jgi:alanine racemase